MQELARADELKAQDHAISYVVVGQLLKLQGNSLQANAKVVEGNQSPDRNAQFEHINASVTAALAAGRRRVERAMPDFGLRKEWLAARGSEVDGV